VPLTLKENGDLECAIEYTFKDEEESVEFAFCYPYKYEQLIKYLNSLNEYICDDELYFHKEVLAYSPQKRPIHLLTITSHDDSDKDKETEELIDSSLFPEKSRPKRFKKPVVLITARVHPG
jgi:hypothetical protein